jgi:hypothetical protein
MAWVESVSPSFRARHSSSQSEQAGRLLESLERTRDRLDELFPRTVPDLTVVMHDSPASLTASNPLLSLRRLAASPDARPYIAGWVGRHEIHVLSPRALDARATNVVGSRQMLARTAPALYARRVFLENNHELSSARAPARLAADLRWAWLLEGAAQWFAGQMPHARPTIARRLRDGRRPSFPPGLRDATLLGCTVVDLLAREEGERTVAGLAARLHAQGARAALSKAFGGRAFARTEDSWRMHLAALAEPRNR